MRNVYILICCLFSSFFMSGQSQLRYQYNAYVAGDSIAYSETNNVSPGNAGANQIWNFSSLVPKGSRAVVVKKTAEIDKKGFYPETNISLREAGTDFMYKVGTAAVYDYGYLQSGYSIHYDQPIQKFAFPFSYGSSFGGKYAGKYSTAGSSGVIAGTYSTEADGYGTLILPGNVMLNNVLRVKFEQDYGDPKSKLVIYRWYMNASVPNLHYSLLTVMTQVTKDSVYTFKTAYNTAALELLKPTKSLAPEAPAYIAPDASAFKIQAYPNPFKDKLNISYSLPKESKVVLYVSDNTGRIISVLSNKTMAKGDYTESFIANAPAASSYIVTLVIDGKVTYSKVFIHSNTE